MVMYILISFIMELNTHSTLYHLSLSSCPLPPLRNLVTGFSYSSRGTLSTVYCAYACVCTDMHLEAEFAYEFECYAIILCYREG